MDYIDYQIWPGVVKVGKTTKMTFTTTGDYYKLFDSLKYTITICPTEYHDKPIDDSFILDSYPYDTFEVKPVDGIITFDYKFKAEQAYGIYIVLSPNQKSKCAKLKRDTHQAFRNAFVSRHRLYVYALESDLYDKVPLRGDTHMHSTYSDGLQDGEVLMSNQHKYGLDFCVLTEHHYYEPSRIIKKKLDELNTTFELILGEEVHNNFMGNLHVVNFGGKGSVNELILKDVEGFSKRVKKESKKLTHIEKSIRIHVAWYKVLKEEINKVGGLAVLSHPYWMLLSYNCPTNVLEAVIENNYFDIFEVFGGVAHSHNTLQVAKYYDLIAKGNRIPIVGCTDSHDSRTPGASEFTEASTIVFKGKDETISDAIMDLRSVAVMSFVNETPKAFGPFRLVNYAMFLFDNYYPAHDRLLNASGILMSEYYRGAPYLKDAIEKTEQRLIEFNTCFFKGIK